MKPLLLKDYTPPKGFMITREATLAVRKRIGHETLVKILVPEIWNMLHDLQGKRVRTRYWNVLQDWSLAWKDGSVKAKCNTVRCNTVLKSYYLNYAEFESELMLYETTFVQRFWKLCMKALCDEKALRGNERKEAKVDAAMEALREYDKKRRENKPVKIHIDLELQAWI